MSEIVVLSGSPSEHSRSEQVLKYLGKLLKQENFSVTHISIQDVPHKDLFQGRFDSPAFIDIANLLQNAKGVIVGSPVYKGAYSGVLKALLDVLPRDVLKHTPVLPLMTGGSMSHLLALEYTLKPLLATLKGHNLKGLYFLDSQIDKYQTNPIIDNAILERTKKQLYYFIELVNNQRSLTLSTY
ncbi:FMN reductase (NADPH) [Virgibacillus profundi]|uniref:FMN reductase (NADPH) n=1 Tax=Virgibacillus profundi TaxID=2024555 RepID=A0A2A2ICK2_9BACI|nr:NADPH-dependent FMN reductase [Virgibacillus profundi]PAV28860.1 FMN reductase (NADPH) [Virgibacillus profundi]PXY53028.1 FMN reductase (NADPH) [Virgibacillus profundi]